MKKTALVMVVLILLGACTLKIEDADMGLQVFDGVATDRIYLKWRPDSSALSYEVMVSQHPDTEPAVLTNITSNRFLHSGLEPGQTWYYRIQAVHSSQILQSSVIMGSTARDLAPAQTGTAPFTYSDGIIYSYHPLSNRKPTNELTILTLNMHTYQETDQDAKLDLIVQAIARLDIDLIALQENAQNRYAAVVTNIGGVSIKDDNMTLILQQRLQENYGLDFYFTWAWAHYGWTEWEEGLAVLSRTPLTDTTNFYISTSKSVSDIASRKVVCARTDIPRLGDTIEMASVHTHWMTSLADTEPRSQVSKVRDFMEYRLTASDLGLVAGDYNSQPTESDPRWSLGYLTMVSNSLYLDTFLEYQPAANNMPENSIYDTVKGDYPGRIDYIFMRTNSLYQVLSSQIVFKAGLLGQVSDHFGVLTRLQK